MGGGWGRKGAAPSRPAPRSRAGARAAGFSRGIPAPAAPRTEAEREPGRAGRRRAPSPARGQRPATGPKEPLSRDPGFPRPRELQARPPRESSPRLPFRPQRLHPRMFFHKTDGEVNMLRRRQHEYHS
nr:translation initiation factor IF-2 [Oryctolagus cuniculus]